MDFTNNTILNEILLQKTKNKYECNACKDIVTFANGVCLPCGCIFHEDCWKFCVEKWDLYCPICRIEF